jgi:hypothetical protein
LFAGRVALLGHANLWTTNLYSHVRVDDDEPPDPFAFAGSRAVG